MEASSKGESGSKTAKAPTSLRESYTTIAQEAGSVLPPAKETPVRSNIFSNAAAAVLG